MHRALLVRAALYGRSTEAKVREILKTVMKPERRVRMGVTLADLGRRIGLASADVEWRGTTQTEPLMFK
jgi:plasmid stability protein